MTDNERTIAKRSGKDGMITKGVGGLYTVLTDSGERVLCRARGLFRHESVTPLVGDRVRVVRDDAAGDDEGEGYLIESILPRRNSLIRPAVANLTHLFVVIPSAKPKPDLLTVDKIIAVAECRGIESVIVVNKSDIDPDEAEYIKGIYDGAFTCMCVSASNGDGCGALLDYLGESSKEKTVIAALAGASAAGKSTLMKRLFPDLDLKTGEVSRKTERGRHTTRHVELFPVLGSGSCYIADTPGFSLLDFTRFNYIPLSDLASSFREFSDYLGGCRYTKCTHTKEEGCAVIGACREGKIPLCRHESYVALYDEIRRVPEWKRKKDLPKEV